jgi:hypothetical protein
LLDFVASGCPFWLDSGAGTRTPWPCYSASSNIFSTVELLTDRFTLQNTQGLIVFPGAIYHAQTWSSRPPHALIEALLDLQGLPEKASLGVLPLKIHRQAVQTRGKIMREVEPRTICKAS